MVTKVVAENRKRGSLIREMRGSSYSYVTSPPLLDVRAPFVPGYIKRDGSYDSYDSHNAYFKARFTGNLVPKKMSVTVSSLKLSKRCEAYWSFRSGGGVGQYSDTFAVYGGTTPYYGITTPTPAVPTGLSSLSRLDKLALSEIHGNVQDARASIMGIVELAEAGKTARLFRDNGKALIKGATDLVLATSQLRRDLLKTLKGGKRLRRQKLTQRYLEYTFGLTPTLLTLNDLRAAIDNPPTPRRLIVKGSAKSVVVFKGPSAVNEGLANSVKCNRSSVTTFERRVRYWAKLYLDTSPVAGLPSQVGLTPDNLLPALYELTPWSFLLDYVTNLGEVVSAINNSMHGINGIYTRSTMDSFSNTETQVFSRQTTGGYTLIATDGPYEAVFNANRFSYTRNLIDELPIPGIGLVDFTFSLSDKMHALNALVLAESAIVNSKGPKQLPGATREAIRRAVVSISR